MSFTDTDAPPLVMYSPPPSAVHRQGASAKPGLQTAARVFAKRSLSNFRHGNPALFVLFLACVVIFMRALFGAGYDEAFSADADASSQQHPSLLARWGHQSQHALEQRWKGLRKSAGDGLFDKIKKEDAIRVFAGHSGEDALHWLHVMEDRALAGLGRRRLPQHEDGAPPTASDGTPQVVAIVPPPVLAPEHPIDEDLDAHDAPEDPPNQEPPHAQPAVAMAVPVAPADQPSPPGDTPDPAAAPPPTRVDPLDSDVHAKHEDADDEPIFDVREP